MDRAVNEVKKGFAKTSAKPAAAVPSDKDGAEADGAADGPVALGDGAGAEVASAPAGKGE
jgi:hypothetical protein